ncbi:MAG TPA: hypothetical protein VGO68_03010 [Pyrinomonadaceae bacterium]|jgi:hypothetical protein|nr:hypothetical protein [Pyrinomonadaceae bacterium]
MTTPIRILMQTTIPFAEDDWHIGRFSLLRDQLASLKDDAGGPLCEVTTRNRESDAAGNDPILSTLDTTDFDELWLFAIDMGDGLTKADCEGITRFRQRGGGIMATRDHQDLGKSLCTLGGIGRAHFFHSKNPELDPSRHVADDPFTTSISWPNYHSGANGDYQEIQVEAPHELMNNLSSPAGVIKFFPAHPHEGAVGVPEAEAQAHVIATGKSQVTDRSFNLVVAFESSVDDHGNELGRGIAESSFHHFVDYNWDTELGCPSFLSEPPGDGYQRNPEALNDIKTYVANAARWLAGH